MALRTQITVKDMPHSDALEARIRRKVALLRKLHRRIVACKVVIQAPHHYQQGGAHFEVRLDIVLPDGEIVANRDHDRSAYPALRDAFLAARRQLIEHLGRAEGRRRIDRIAQRHG